MNPSPFLFFLNFGNFQLAGSSHEIMVRLRDNKITIRPIAGTRPRGKTPEEDLALEKDLLSDPKELSEHLMLLDLGRNDVGRVVMLKDDGRSDAAPAKPRVRVTEQFTIERYATVTTGPSLTGAITAADLDRSGDHLLVRTYGAVREVAKTSKAPASALLERSPGTVTCRPPTPPEVQGEAIAFEADGRGFVSVSEGGSPVLRRYAPAPADSSSTSAP
jgi:hypothetical protein